MLSAPAAAATLMSAVQLIVDFLTVVAAVRLLPARHFTSSYLSLSVTVIRHLWVHDISAARKFQAALRKYSSNSSWE